MAQRSPASTIAPLWKTSLADNLDFDEERINAARKYGYSDDEIRTYLEKRRTLGQGPVGPGAARQPNYPAFKDPSGRMVPAATREPSEAGFMERMKASFKSTPEERTAFYKSARGEDNVTVTPAGEILLRQNGKWVNVDSPDLTWNDLADLAGDAPEMLGTLLGGWKNKVWKAAAGSAIGNTIKQAIGGVIEGDSNRGVLDRAGEVAGSAVAGGVSQAVGNVLGGSSPIRPTEIARQQLQKRVDKLGTTELAKEGQELGKVFPLNLAEETADPWARMILGFAYRNAYGQELAALDKAAKDRAALAMFKRLSGTLGKAGGFENKTFAEAAEKAGQRSIADIDQSLAQSAKTDYGFLHTPEGAVPAIEPKRLNTLIDEVASYYEGMGTKEGAAMAKRIQGMKPQSPKTGDEATAEALLAELGGESGGGGFRLTARGVQHLLDKFGQGGDLASLRTVRGKPFYDELRGALRQDLSEAAGSGGVPGSSPESRIAQKLLAARSKTEELQGLKKTLSDIPLLKFMESKGLLEKALGPEGALGMEQVGPHLLKGMREGSITPSEIQNMTKLLQATNPNFHHDLARMVIDEAVKAGKKVGMEGIKPSKFDYRAAYKALPSPEYLGAIYGDIWDPAGKATGMKVANDLGMLMRAIQRAETVGQGIPHSPGTTALGIASHIIKGNFGAATEQALSQVLFPKAVAGIAMPQARRELMQKMGEATTPRTPGFMDKYLEHGLPPLLYELMNSTPRANRADTGK